MNEIEIQKMFFDPVCNKGEIERIFNPQNAKDYLLKLRAETIVDHMRLFRVYRNKALLNENNWSLEDSFDFSHYEEFLSNINDQESEKCKIITAGNIFSNDPNGKIFISDCGLIITICDSLRFFLKFMNLALMDFEDRVPEDVCINSLRIAIRVMLKTEALDFLMDPRGIVPADIGKVMHSTIPDQLLFIAGHEFSHSLLNHISDESIIERPILNAIFSNDEDYKPMKVYNQSQDQEFEADINSILLPKYSEEKRTKIMEAALLWFGCLDIYEAVLDAICPHSLYAYNTHPPARERFDHILSTVTTPVNYGTNKWRGFFNRIDHYRSIILKDIALNIETYETYGSSYLDKPNTEWRGPKLRDRLDYY